MLEDAGIKTEQSAAAAVQADLKTLIQALEPVLSLAAAIQDALKNGRLVITVEKK